MAKPSLRFGFGKNWHRFARTIDDQRIAKAAESLVTLLGVSSLNGKSFLDIGCGSGLFSLAALRLGATRVHSFDYDPDSVATARAIEHQFSGNDERWRIEQGDVLDTAYLKQLGVFDIVYSWGVLHHTGHLWQALESAGTAVQSGGLLCVALYNDQGWQSALWRAVKMVYNRLPGVLKYAVLIPSFIRLWGPTLLRDFLKGDSGATWRTYRKNRGMSPWYDVVDWVGGYPFEVASPAAVVDFYQNRGFRSLKLVTCGTGHGNNEFIFQKICNQGTQH
jgi:2-polyprenyl-6-hydroxyphenyl methylase/3-demethylubiquinone-9 3-methyltransferase